MAKDSQHPADPALARAPREPRVTWSPEAPPSAFGRVTDVRVAAYRVPTDFPEADGTITWDGTTMVLVEVDAGGRTGLGWTYGDAACARIVRDVLAEHVRGTDPLAIGGTWLSMVRAVRNLGRPGVGLMALSAVDVALWDLKARLLGVCLADLLGRVRDAVPLYGSGGFTTYPMDRLCAQLGGWAEQGFRAVKMKVGQHPEHDLARVEAAREAIGRDVALYVDANGAYQRKQALAFAERWAELSVTWFEEPVSSDDLEGLRLIRDRAPAGMDVAAGEYGTDAVYFRRMLEAGAVDVLQADATRCGGVTGYLQACAVADAHHVPVSPHTAPTLHAHLAAVTPHLAPLEWFHDHVRLEHLLFDGVLDPVHGTLRPDAGRPGLGVVLKRVDAEKYAI